jgi:anti-sigma-K factor RskA
VNVKEYIVSGIVESYVMGLASKEEMAEFERMCAAHHEVQVAKEAFEKQLEQHALNNAIQPPAHLQSKIFAELEVESDKLRANGSVFTAPAADRQAPVVSMRWWKYAAVASVILLTGSIVLNVYFARQSRNYENLYTATLTEYANSRKTMQEQLTAYQQSMNIFRDTNMVVVAMKGVSKFPDSRATVYWDSRSKAVYLMVNNLPAPEEGKQYQLWALVNGQPVDAGMLDWKQSGSVALMKNIPAAQGFAITLEKAGGSSTPDMKAMYVIGTI